MEAVRLLLKSGVDINAKDLEGHTARDILAEQTQVQSNSEIRDRVMLELCQLIHLFNPQLTTYNYSRYLCSIVSSRTEDDIKGQAHAMHFWWLLHCL